MSKARGTLYWLLGFLAPPSRAGESLVRILPSHCELLGGCLEKQSLPHPCSFQRISSPQVPAPHPCLPEPALWLPMLARTSLLSWVTPLLPRPHLLLLIWALFLNSVQAWDFQLGFRLATLINFRHPQEFLPSLFLIWYRGSGTIVKCQTPSCVTYPLPAN